MRLFSLEIPWTRLEELVACDRKGCPSQRFVHCVCRSTFPDVTFAIFTNVYGIELNVMDFAEFNIYIP